MKKSLSYKNLLLLLGILVAVAIALTTLVYRDRPPAQTTLTTPAKTSILLKPSVLLKKYLGRKVVASFHSPSR